MSWQTSDATDRIRAEARADYPYAYAGMGRRQQLMEELGVSESDLTAEMEADEAEGGRHE